MPLYLHPAAPREAVEKAYFSGLEPGLARILSIAGWGWHAEQGLHTIRLIATGVFDRFPKLEIIIGHMGEMIPSFLARTNAAVTPFTKLKRTVADYFHTNVTSPQAGYLPRRRSIWLSRWSEPIVFYFRWTTRIARMSKGARFSISYR